MSEAVHRKSDAIAGWNLADMAAMGACVDELADLLPEWRGSMNRNSGGAWVVQFNADNPSRAIFADIGDWLVVDLGQLMHFTATEFGTYYDVGGA